MGKQGDSENDLDYKSTKSTEKIMLYSFIVSVLLALLIPEKIIEWIPGIEIFVNFMMMIVPSIDGLANISPYESVIKVYFSAMWLTFIPLVLLFYRVAYINTKNMSTLKFIKIILLTFILSASFFYVLFILFGSINEDSFSKIGVVGRFSAKMNYYLVNTKLGLGALGGIVFITTAFFLANFFKCLCLFVSVRVFNVEKNRSENNKL